MSVFTHSVCIKAIYSRNFRCSAKGAVILFFSWSTLYIVFSNCVVSSFYLFYFNLSLFTRSACVKVTFFWNFRCSAKDAVILLRLWSTMYIAFLKCKVSWFYFFYFNFQLLTESAHVKVNFSWNLSAPRKMQWYCFARGAPCI